MREQEIAETTPVEVEGTAVAGAALCYLAILAYPLNWEKRDLLIHHLKDLFVRALAHPVGSPEHRKRKHRLREAGCNWKPSKFEKTRGVINKGFGHIAKRLAAAECAGLMIITKLGRPLIDVTMDEVFEFSRKGKRPWRPTSIRAFGRLGAECFQMDEAHFRQRIWRPSLPVLHLAIMCPKMKADEKYHHYALRLLFSPEWARTAIFQAETYRRGFGYLLPSFQRSRVVRLLPSEPRAAKALARTLARLKGASNRIPA